MDIRPATYADLDRLMEVYEIARQYMRAQGNTVQWTNGYPSREVLANDIDNDWLYVIEEDGVVHASFAFVLVEEEYYRAIEGAWLNNDPFGAIHRVASDGTLRGVVTAAVEFCKSIRPNLRIDTHETNGTMRHVLEKNGFVECGTVYVFDGTPRVAYQLSC